jgi:hypothetical protein
MPRPTPGEFTRQVYAQKCAAVCQHVFDSYWDDGHSVYERAAQSGRGPPPYSTVLIELGPQTDVIHAEVHKKRITPRNQGLLSRGWRR